MSEISMKNKSALQECFNDVVFKCMGYLSKHNHIKCEWGNRFGRIN
jgi:hypothetical protein